MPHSGDQEDLILAELRKLRARLTDEGDPNETAMLAICLGDFCCELCTRLVASGNITTGQARAFLLKLANAAGSHPRVPANGQSGDGRLRIVR